VERRLPGGADLTVPRALRLGLVAGLSLAAGALLAEAAHRWNAGDDGVEDAPPPAAAPGRAPVPAGRARIRVEVLNAAGVAGLADRATDHLRSRGFDVVGYGNAAAAPRTAVLDRVSSPALAREVAGELGGAPVATRLAPDGLVDVTVVLGADHARWLPEDARRDGPAPGPIRD
jgi:hypothetical protein